METKKAELGDGEPSAPPDYEDAKKLEQIRRSAFNISRHEGAYRVSKPWFDGGWVVPLEIAIEAVRSGAAQEVSPPSPELWETLAQAMCRNEYSASRSFDEQVTPSRQLWQRFETEAKFAIEAIENAGYKISKHGAGDTRELKAALKQCYQVLWNAKFDIPDMIDAKRAALKEIERLLGEPT